MAFHFNKPNLISKLVKEVVQVHDWLTGPAMSEHDRVEREIAESNGWRSGGITGL